MIIKLKKFTVFGKGYTEDTYEIPDEVIQQLVTLIVAGVLNTPIDYPLKTAYLTEQKG